jgi:hypothetical protein
MTRSEGFQNFDSRITTLVESKLELANESVDETHLPLKEKERTL